MDRCHAVDAQAVLFEFGLDLLALLWGERVERIVVFVAWHNEIIGQNLRSSGLVNK